MTATPPTTIAPNPTGIPNELRAINQWVAWKWALRPTKQGVPKWTKPPIDPHEGGKASVSDPTTWAGFDQTLAAYRTWHAAGVGLVLNGSGLVAVDLDHCRVPETGAIEPWAAAIVARLATYTEI